MKFTQSNSVLNALRNNELGSPTGCGATPHNKKWRMQQKKRTSRYACVNRTLLLQMFQI